MASWLLCTRPYKRVSSANSLRLSNNREREVDGEKEKRGDRASNR